MSRTKSIQNALPNPAGVLFGAYRRQILALLLLQPEDSFYVREIARLTGVPAGSLHRELKLLVNAGLLLRTTAGNQVRYQADRSCPIYKEMVGIFREIASEFSESSQTTGRQAAEPPAPEYITKPSVNGEASQVLNKLKISRAALVALGRRHHLQRLSLFGSVVRDDFRPDSDIDVLVESSQKHPLTLSKMADLREEISALFKGRKVDVATPAIFRNPYRRKAIERDLKPIYVAK